MVLDWNFALAATRILTMTPTERRRIERKTLDVHFRVSLGKGAPSGNVADLSEAGMMIIHKAPLQPGDAIELTVELPPEWGRPLGLCVAATCRWTSEPAADGRRSSGFQFAGLAPDQQDLVRRILQKHSS